jgi:hypothetical protein
MTNYTIEIDGYKKCAECGKAGVVPCGLCLDCVSKVLSGKKMKSEIGKAVQLRAQRREAKP